MLVCCKKFRLHLGEFFNFVTMKLIVSKIVEDIPNNFNIFWFVQSHS